MNESNLRFVTILSYILIGLSAFSLLWSFLYPFIVKLFFNLTMDGNASNNFFEMMPPMMKTLFSNIEIVATVQAILSLIALIGAIGMLKQKFLGLMIVSIVIFILSGLSFVYSFYLSNDLVLLGYPETFKNMVVAFSYLISFIVFVLGALMYISPLRKHFK